MKKLLAPAAVVIALTGAAIALSALTAPAPVKPVAQTDTPAVQAKGDSDCCDKETVADVQAKVDSDCCGKEEAVASHAKAGSDCCGSEKPAAKPSAL